jgi:hypothetical protein
MSIEKPTYKRQLVVVIHANEIETFLAALDEVKDSLNPDLLCTSSISNAEFGEKPFVITSDLLEHNKPYQDSLSLFAEIVQTD